MSIAPARIKKLPDAPGVYLFKKRRKVLYVGKATSLRDRVRSYFSADLIDTRGPRLVDMVTKANRVSFKKTDSVLEALLLEAELIKKLEPPYNTDGKDDKSFNCVVITDEDFPRVLIVRQKDLLSKANEALKLRKLKAVYGPFPHGSELREALKIIRKIFPYRDTCKPLPANNPVSRYSNILKNVGISKACFNHQIGLCPGVCTSEISKKDYAKVIRWIKMFFQGEKRGLVRNMTREMNMLAKMEEFERAAEIRQKIFALNHIRDIALIKKEHSSSFTSHRIEAFDIAHTGGKNVVGVMTVVWGGEANKKEYRTFNVKTAKPGSDTNALKEILSRRLRHEEWHLPDLIVVDGGKQQLNAALGVVRKALAAGDTIPVVSVVKDERHRPREILGNIKSIAGREREILLANGEAHRFALSFHRRSRSKTFLV